MNIFLVNTDSGVQEPPISVGGFVDVPSPGETIVGTPEANFNYFFGRTIVEEGCTLITVSNYSLIQSEQANSKPILCPWYEGRLGGGDYCLVNDEPNSIPHRDIPFLAYRDTMPDSYGGIVLRPMDNLIQVAYYANYSYYSGITLGSTCLFGFGGRRINLPAGLYAFGYGYNEIMRPSTTLYNFIILYLMLDRLHSGAFFNETNVICEVTPEGYITVEISENIQAGSLTLKLEF